MGWALLVLTIVTTVQGQMADALALFDRALAVTQADPALTDLRLLLQISQAVVLGYLDQYEEAFAAAAGPATRRSGRRRRSGWLRRTTALGRLWQHGAMGRCAG